MATFIKAGSSIKRVLFVTAVAAVLSACASKQTQPEPVEEPTVVQEPEVVATPIDRAPTRVVEEPVPASLETVFYFDFDSSQLKTGARAALDAQAAYLRNTSTAIRLEGHADERGTREYNLALGERRAKAVADYLAIQGVSRSRIEVVSYGEERPISLRSDESGWSMNRRVELK
ncbi:MAG: peptidoglycan-associated lipoprotein Pal [Gammaproteobacteria bacterium]|nr:peptidoglycan-associated lipoprotein Pal [Gammaproteobacteria bacterium]NND39919.1 peptidoglycan-associated lipoprotein Pal [Pseudomonadales bacterium]MBT8150819.1 peptidoglycan-associated lipoprotein Pal [Gammaproteobacteria bacterium]NNL11875.1 peptidoglycan-associated lipoprotein Pal [Pseudomonadales bacterium]NNM11538.1 peptidoglycan-associated lipoprotein Pal [Pseudomonadales bacterium]